VTGLADIVWVIGPKRQRRKKPVRQAARPDGVTPVLTRDAIGQFPDQNVAESLRRLPGYQIILN